MYTTRDTCDFYCDEFPFRDASPEENFCFTKMSKKKVDFCTLVFVRNTIREEGTGPMSCNNPVINAPTKID